MWFFKRKKKKKKKPNRAVRYLSVFIYKLLKRGKVADKIYAMNLWADGHRKATAYTTIGLLTVFTFFGVVFPVFFHDKEEHKEEVKLMEGIADLQPMFSGMQKLEANKNHHAKVVAELCKKSETLKTELDSLMNLEHKSHEDSVKIMSNYNQLSVIVNQLKVE